MSVFSSSSNRRSPNSSILARLRERDQVAWQELVELYTPLIVYWCRSKGLDSHSSADVLQDVFASVARTIDRYEIQSQAGSFRAWLWTITRHKLIDWRRQRERLEMPRGGSTAMKFLEQIAEPLSASDSDESQCEPTSEIELSSLMRRAIRQIEPEFAPQTWTAFERTVIDGRDTQSVAEELGVTPAAIRQTKSRILRRLRQQLGDMM